MQHAPFSPSAAERWIACQGSHQAEQQAGPQPASDLAEEGTQAHAIFAEALRNNVSPYQLTSDAWIAAPLQEAWLAAYRLIRGRRVLIEQRLPPLPGLEVIWGTADVLVLDQRDRLELILDLKFGRGVVVEADTVQLAIYALLGAQHFGAPPSGVTAGIIQPRALHISGPVRLHQHSPMALDAVLTTLRGAVEAAGQSGAPRNAGPWCRFCAAANSCPARHRVLQQESPSAWHTGAPQR